MSVEAVKKYLEKWGKAEAVQEFAVSSATVDLAAQALGVAGQRIAKTLSFMKGKDKGDIAPDGTFALILVVAAGDAKVDNAAFKNQFGFKAKMLSPDEVLAGTGHAVGGVCPFALNNPLAEVYLDISMKRFPTVFPACGSSNSAVELTCDELFEMAGARAWVDVCKAWRDI